VHHPAVGPQDAVLGEGVVDDVVLHPGKDLGGIVRVGRLRRQEIGVDGGVKPGHEIKGLGVLALLEFRVEPFRFRRIGPRIPRQRHDGAVQHGKAARALDVGNVETDGHDLDALGHQAELLRRLDGVGHGVAGVGQREHLRPRGLSLKNEGRQVRDIEGVIDDAQHLAAGLFHVGGGGVRQEMTEIVVGADDEPGLAEIGHRVAHRLAELVGVIGPLRAVGGALLAGQLGGAGRAVEHHLVALPRDILHRERDRRHGHVENRVDMLAIVPALGDGDADIGLVLVIAMDDDDGHAVDLVVELVGRDLGGDHRSHAISDAINAGKIVENAELDHVIGKLRVRAGRGHHHGEGGGEAESHPHVVSSQPPAGTAARRPRSQAFL
jgi:hypothetical protein